jgi:hypothetical protein
VGKRERYDLGLQAWLGCHERPANSMVERYERDDVGTGPKPKGFFTSTWDLATRTNAWLLFGRTTSRDPTTECGGGPRLLWLLLPSPAQVFVIDSSEDFDALVEQHGPDKYGRPYPNWRKVYESDLAAVHVTPRGAADDRVRQSWGCESTVWLKWELTLVGCLGAVRRDWTVAPAS